MVGVSRALEVFQVASRACTAGQIVVPVYMALRTRQSCVGSGKSESRGRMVEGRIPPGRSVVAALTSLRYSSLHVVGIGCALEVLEVAGHASRSGQVVVSADVALRTLQWHVRPGQWEAGR